MEISKILHLWVGFPFFFEFEKYCFVLKLAVNLSYE